jgi:hypothetical protein
MHAAEADAFEPRRGSRAEVSLIVVAVDDHRPARIERRRRLDVERLQREVERTREVLVVETVRRQNLDELGIFVAAKELELIAVDWCRHLASLIGFTKPATVQYEFPKNTQGDTEVQRALMDDEEERP